jgi:predicted nucleotide-binding protein
MKHSGTLDDLKSIVGSCGFTVIGEKENANGWQIRTDKGAIINWFPSTSTLQIQGKKDVKREFEDAWATYNGSPSSVSGQSAGFSAPEAPKDRKVTNKKIFVVHGHDTVSREQLELVLHKIGLDPFILANTSGGGLTIIEALESEIGPGASAA